jgi:hypothetical protein
MYITYETEQENHKKLKPNKIKGIDWHRDKKKHSLVEKMT